MEKLAWHYQVLCFLLLILYYPTSAQLCPHDQAQALIQFRSSFDTNSSNPGHHCNDAKTQSWKEGTDCCLWEGVTCDATRNVIDLNLSCSWLLGTIPYNSSLSLLPHLQRLNLAYNDSESSSIPSELFGPLAVSPPSTEALFISNNKLTRGLPSILCNLISLEVLDLSNNSFSGKIPECLGNLSSNLTFLNLQGNKLTGGLPSILCNLISLEFLDLADNNFSGKIPECLGNLSSHLTLLNLQGNKLTGGLPSILCNLISLEFLDLSDSNFSGKIPECLGNFSSALKVLHIQGNQLNGKIPGTFSERNKLISLNFNGNKLEGPLPRTLADCTMLEVLNLGNNKIRDTFPYWLDTLPELHVLILRSNRFHGAIDTSKTRNPFPKLRVLDLSHNDFTGLLPAAYFESLKAMESVEETDEAEYLGDSYYQDSMVITVKDKDVEYKRILTILTAIDMSNNKFEGQIPAAVGHLSKLIILNFSRNSLLGRIPPSLGNLSVLESFDLSWNKLTGEIPGQLTNMQFLEVLNLSQNQLVGPIPHGKQFDTFLNDSYTGNLGLCGFPMSKSCSNNKPTESPGGHDDYDEEDDSASSFDWKSAMMMGYGCGIVIGVSIAYIVFATGRPWWLVKMVEKERLKRERRPTNPRIKNRRHHNRT